jgi:outer membrane protein OmpA-like peptidoglycan-associated protein
MSTVFISYRRADSADVTGRIWDHLGRHLGKGRLFRDVASIAGGEDFRSAIHQAISSCQVVLVVIGPHWLAVTDRGGNRRLDDPEDPVRVEIETSLNAGKRIIPLLVGGAAMPTPNALPDSLRPLAGRNAIQVRPDPDFGHDIARLVREISRSHSRTPNVFRRAAMAILLGAAIALYIIGTELGRWMRAREQTRVVQAVEREFRNEVIAGEMSFLDTPGELYIRFSQDVLFPAGGYEVSSHGNPLLQRLATVVDSLEAQDGRLFTSLHIEGHTDDVPFRRSTHPRDNWELSAARAGAVARSLTSDGRHRLDPSRIMATGRAGYQPVSKVRALNRRTEIRIFFHEPVLARR